MMKKVADISLTYKEVLMLVAGIQLYRLSKGIKGVRPVGAQKLQERLLRLFRKTDET